MSSAKDEYEDCLKNGESLMDECDYANRYIIVLEKDNGIKYHYIQILETFIISNSNDSAAFIVANKIKSPRVNAREKQNENPYSGEVYPWGEKIK